LIIAHGDPLVFFKRPISATLIGVAVFMMISSYYRIKKAMEREEAEQRAALTDNVNAE
jgi:TctA family transporter